MFTNAVTRKPEITALMHDAQYYEQMLFTTKGQQPARSTHGQSEVQFREGASSNLNVDNLCIAIEKLASAYPIESLDAQLAYYRSKAQRLYESIARYEDVVHEQQQRLGQLNQSREIFQDAANVQRVISQLEQDVRDLESELTSRHNELLTR